MSKKTSYPKILDELRDICKTAGIYSHTLSMADDFISLIDESPLDSVTKSYRDKLLKVQSQKDFLEKAEEIDRYLQTLGEAYFYCLCLNYGLNIKKISTKANQSTPDFSIEMDGIEVFFEVKTPSLADGAKHTAKHIVHYRKGERAQHYSPYQGSKWPAKGQTRGVVEVVNQKISNSHKSEQFANRPTFLVINLLQLHPMPQTAEALCPIYINRSTENLEAGLLWTIAFCHKGMLSFDSNIAFPKPPIDGYIDGDGLLIRHPEISGILFVIRRVLNNRMVTDLFGCLRSSRYEPMEFEGDALQREIEDAKVWEEPKVDAEWERHQEITRTNEVIKKYLVDDFFGWNDDKDTNGSRLRRRDKKYRRDD